MGYLIDIEMLNTPCIHCWDSEYVHPYGKCLFQSTCYQALPLLQDIRTAVIDRAETIYAKVKKIWVQWELRDESQEPLAIRCTISMRCAETQRHNRMERPITFHMSNVKRWLAGKEP